MADFLKRIRLGLRDHVIDFHDDLTGDRIGDLLTRDAAIDAGGERGNFLVAVVDRCHGDAVGGAAILLENDHVLGDIDELAGHVSGVSRFQGGVGEAFAGTVGGDEILQHGEAFAEVRDDGALDDLAGGLGH